MKYKGSVLVVEDDTNQRYIIKTILTKEGFYVEDADCGKKAIEILKAGKFDLVLTDLRLPDIEGTEVLKEVRALGRTCHVIIVTAFGSIPSAIEATKLGAFYYLEKPLEKDQLLLVVQNALNQINLLKDNIMLKDQLRDRFHIDNVVGAHGSMEEVYKIVEKVAPTTSTVLIQGESGTGKELFAKSIHYNSPRRNKPFFALNCAAIPETLLESELFGYEKGAFTGALSRHIGLFEQANGSTLFLDEIGDLSSSTQAKLLRALQEKEIRRIGGKETTKLDVRIIAATNKKLDEEIRQGRFRSDLFYRLNVIAFTIPPLRERITDIPLLIEHFLKKLDKVHGTVKQIGDESLQVFMKYHWPGNVRQLESVLERSYILCEGGCITLAHVPAEVKQTEGVDVTAKRLNSMADRLIEAKLTAAEYRLYLYLAKLDPLSETFHDCVEVKEVTNKLGINRDTFFVAIAKLKQLGLYDLRENLNISKKVHAPKSNKPSQSEISD